MSKKSKKNVPKLRFKEFTERWIEIRIAQISKIVTSGSRDWAQFYSKHGAKFIRMTNLDRHRINLLLDDLQHVSLPPNHSEGQRTALQPGDILISITAELGKIGIVPSDLGEAYISQHVGLVRPDSHQINPTFLAIQLSTPESNKRLNRLNDSGAKSGLNLGSIKNFLIEIPNIAEQEKIASFLGSIDTRLNQLRRKHELLQTYKRGVMQKLFSQQIRFKDDRRKPFPDWEKKRLETIFSEFKSGYNITSDELTECGRYPVFGGNGVRGYSEEFTHDGFYFLIGRQGALCGNIHRSYEKAYISEHAIACKANEASDTEWLAQRLDYYNLNKLSESSAQPGLSVSKLLRFKLLTPCKKEQEKMAVFLTTIDQKIDAISKQIDLTEQFKKGLLQKMFV